MSGDSPDSGGGETSVHSGSQDCTSEGHDYVKDYNSSYEQNISGAAVEGSEVALDATTKATEAISSAINGVNDSTVEEGDKSCSLGRRKEQFIEQPLNVSSSHLLDNTDERLNSFIALNGHRQQDSKPCGDSPSRATSVLRRQAKLEKELSDQQSEVTIDELGKKSVKCNSLYDDVFHQCEAECSGDKNSYNSNILKANCDLNKTDIESRSVSDYLSPDTGQFNDERYEKSSVSQGKNYKIYNNIIKSSSFTSKLNKKCESLVSKSASNSRTNTLEDKTKSESCSSISSAADKDELFNSVDTTHTLPNKRRTKSSNEKPFNKDGQLSNATRGKWSRRKLISSNSVDVSHNSSNSTIISPDEETSSSSVISKTNQKKPKHTAFHSIFSSGNLLEQLQTTNPVSVFTASRKSSAAQSFAQRSLSTTCDKSPNLNSQVREATSTSSLSSFAAGNSSVASGGSVEGEDTVPRLPKFSKIKVQSSRNLLSGKSVKLSSKNCYRLVILGSSKVGKSSLISR